MILARHAPLLVAFAFGISASACGGADDPADASIPDTSAPDADASEPDADASAPDADAGPPDADAGSVLGTVDFVPGVTVSTLAGSATSGGADGTAGAASFDNPTGLALSSGGELFVTEYDGGRVRAITSAGVVRTVAATAGFVGPFSAAFAPAGGGALLIGTDFDASGVKGPTTGTVWRVALGGAGIVAPTVVLGGFGRPRGLVALADGRLFVSDRLRSVVGTLELSTSVFTALAGQEGVTGYADGAGASAKFYGPHGCAQLADGSVVVADMANHRLRRVTLAGEVSTFAGSGVAGTHDAPALSARFQSPRDVAVDAAGYVYVVDIGVTLDSGAWVDLRVRRVTPSGVVQTLAGDGAPGYVDGAGASAEFYGLEGIDVTADGKTVYVSDGNGGDGSGHHRVRKITVP